MTQSNIKKKGCGCLPLIGVFFLVGLGGSYLFFRNFLEDELSFSQAAEIIPEEAVMTSFISTNSQNWSKLTEFGTPQTKAIINENWQELQQQKLDDLINNWGKPMLEKTIKLIHSETTF